MDPSGPDPAPWEKHLIPGPDQVLTKRISRNHPALMIIYGPGVNPAKNDVVVALFAMQISHDISPLAPLGGGKECYNWAPLTIMNDEIGAVDENGTSHPS